MSAVSKYRAALEAPTPVGPSKTNVTPLRPDMTATAPAQAAMHYKLAIYNGLKAEQPIRFIEGSARDTLTQLEQVVEVADKKAAHLFSVAVLRDDLQTGESTLAGKAHAGVQAIVLDVDGATAEQIDAFDAELRERGWLHLKYPTHSWTDEQPRFRYLLLLARVAPAGKNYTNRLWAPMNALSGGICDPSAKDGARRSFLPSCPPGQAGSRPAPEIHGTRLLDPDELVALLPPAELPKPGVSAAASTRPPDADGQADRRDRDPGLIAAGCSMFAKFLKDGDPDNGHGDGLWRLAGGIAHYVADGAKLFHESSAKDPRYDFSESQAKFEGYKGGPPLCKTIESSGWGGCKTCPSRGKIASPVQLADSLDTVAPDPTAALQQALTSGSIRAEVDQDGTLNYVTSYERNGRRCRDVVRASTTAARDLLLHAATVGGGKAPSDRAIEAMEARIRVEAKRSGTVTPTHVRIAEQGGVYYHDGQPGWLARIDSQGWQVMDESDGTPLFRRGTGAGELPDPTFNGTAKQALASCLDGFRQLGCDTAQGVIATAAMVDALRPETAKPVIEVVGPAGSGKSTLADFFVDLLDPSDSERRVTGHRAEDVAAGAQHQRVLMIDNASRFDKTFSDLLCTVSTGGTQIQRQLYTNAEVVSLNIKRTVVVTGVSPVCTQSDLQSRVLRFEVRPPTDGGYLSESEVRELTRALRPPMLGAIYTLLSAALRELPEVRKRKDWRHRMVSFDQLGEAVMISAGYKAGSFLTIIGRMRERMARRTASGDVFTLKLTEALRALAAGDKAAEQPTLGTVLGTKQQLVVWDCGDGRVEITARPGALRRRMPAVNSWDRDSPIPATDRAFLDALRRVQPLLGSLGVTCTEESYGSRPVVRMVFKPLELDHE